MFGLVGWLSRGLIIGLVTGLMVMLLVGFMYSVAWSTPFAFAQLAWRWHTPVRLMRFLEDAHKRDVLRTVGPIYQFRHARLQDRLADQANTATSPEQQAVGTEQAVRTAL